MRKIFIYIAVIILGISFSAYAVDMPDSKMYTFYVRDIPIQIISIEEGQITYDSRTDYSLFYGVPEAEQYDEMLSRGQSNTYLFLIHPVPHVADEMGSDPYRWYAQVLNERAGMSSPMPVFDKETWRYLPPIVKNILIALDYTDDELLLINFRLYTKSISIFYHPRNDQDKAFYEEKLKMLLAKFEGKDIHEDVPFPLE